MKGLLVFVKLEGHILNILSASKTYIDDPASYAKTFEDLLIQSAVLDHAAWLSVTTCQAALLWRRQATKNMQLLQYLPLNC